MSSTAALRWFARHELRLAWREWLAMMTAGRRGRKRTAIIGLTVFAAIMHLPAYAVIGRFADLQPPLDKSTLIVMTATILLAWALMLSQAIESVTRVFYARADLDLIVSSPVRLANVFSVRIAAVALSVIAMALLLSTPFVDVLVIGGGARWFSAVWRGRRDRIVGIGGRDRGHGGAVSPDRPEPDPAGGADSRRHHRRRLRHRAADRRDPVLRHAVAVRGFDLGCRSGVRTRSRQHAVVAGARRARRRRGAAASAGRRPRAARRRDGGLLGQLCRHRGPGFGDGVSGPPRRPRESVSRRFAAAGAALEGIRAAAARSLAGVADPDAAACIWCRRP